MQLLINSGFNHKLFTVLLGLSELVLSLGRSGPGLGLFDPQASLFGWPNLGRGELNLSCSCASVTQTCKGAPESTSEASW